MKVLSTIPKSSYSPATTTPVEFFHLIERLKTTPREGWRRFGIGPCESIADHMYRMSIITMLAPRSLAAGLDMARCTRMALVHDMAESLVGDITPIDGVSKPEKSRREGETMDYLGTRLLGCYDDGHAGKDLIALWAEYEDGQSREARFVKDVDKLELLLQMVEYEKRGKGKLDLGEFCWVRRGLALPEMQAWADELMQERRAFWQSVDKVPDGMDIS